MKFLDKSGSRSEEIRNRRSNPISGSKKVSKKRTDRIGTPKPTPVLVRKPMNGISQPVAKKSTRRQKYLNLSRDPIYNSELRLPVVAGVKPGWRLVSLFISALSIYGLYFIWQSPSFRVDAPNIEGLNTISSTQLINELRLLGQPVFLMDAVTLENEILNAFPEFSSADVQIQFPNKTNITVTERVPVLVWMGESESVLVDIQGVPFPNRGAVSPGELPVVQATGKPAYTVPAETEETTLQEKTIQKITGLIDPTLSLEGQFEPIISPSMVQSVLILAKQSPDGAKLIYDPVHGFGWTDRRGWNVYLGSADEMETKIQIYRAIMEDLKKNEKQPTLISVEFAYAPYFRIDED